jgi:hypothetical protein
MSALRAHGALGVATAACRSATATDGPGSARRPGVRARRTPGLRRPPRPGARASLRNRSQLLLHYCRLWGIGTGKSFDQQPDDQKAAHCRCDEDPWLVHAQHLYLRDLSAERCGAKVIPLRIAAAPPEPSRRGLPPPGHPTARRLVIAALLLLLSGAQYWIRIDPAQPLATVAFLLTALATALILGTGPGGARPAEARREEGVPVLALAVMERRLAVLGTLAIGAASVVLSIRWQRCFLLGAILFVGGVTLLSLALARAAHDATAPAPPWSVAEAATLLAIVALALALRLYRFTEFPDPYGIFAIEEPQTGMGGASILEGYRPWEFLLDHYLAALALWCGGASLPAIRLPFALCSAVTVVPLYLLLRQLMRRRAALCGAFLLAISSWHLVYARCAHNIFLGTLLVVCVWALLAHGERVHRLAVYPWIGFLTACTLFGYAGYRATVGLVLLFLALALARHWRAQRRAPDSPAAGAAHAMLRRDLAGLGISAFVVVAAIPPLAVRVYTDPHPNYSYFEAARRSLANRTYYTSDVRDFVAQRLERARAAAAIFLHHGDDSPTFNADGAPMLDPVTGTLFVAGLLYATCFPSRRHNGYFVAVGVILFAGGTIFVQNLDVRRLQGIIPLVCLFAALCVDRLLAEAEAAGRIARGILTLVGGAAAAFALWWNYDLFFNKIAGDALVRAAFHNEYMELIRLARRDLPGHYFVVLSDLPNFFTESDYRWMIRGHIAGEPLDDLTAILPPHALPGSGRPLSIVLLPPYDAPGVAALLRGVYPGTECRIDVTPDAPQLRMTVCAVPAARSLATTPAPARQPVGTLTAAYFLRRDAAAPPALVRAEPFIAYALVPDVCRDRTQEPEVESCTVEWIGRFELPLDTTVRFAGETRGGSLKISIDGRRVHGLLRLGAGAHELKAVAVIPRTHATGAQVRWRLGRQPAVLVPFYGATAAPAG